MARFGQVGIALAALGGVLALMGLFPGIAGVEPTVGMGVVQVFMVLVGYGLVILGGAFYQKRCTREICANAATASGAS